jgi:Tfp pilus assembly protein FimT
MIVVAIIAILATVILVGMGQVRKNTRVNSAKTTLKTALLVMVACLDSGAAVNSPVGSGGNQICTTVNGADWPILTNGYAYESVNSSNSTACNFVVSTNGDTPNLTCGCVTQLCQ